MKPGAPQKVKFLRLKRALRLPYWQVVGLLESLWLATYANAPCGDIGRLSNADIASLIEYDSDADELIEALVDSGWLDRDPEYRLIVHDWSEHCSSSHKANCIRYGRKFADVAAKERLNDPPEPPMERPTDPPSKPPMDDRSDGPSLSLSLSSPLLNLSSPFLSSVRSEAAPNGAPDSASSATTKRTSQRSKRSPVDVPVPTSLAVEPFISAWSDWIAFRRKKRFPCDCIVLTRQLNSLAPLGPRLATECVESSLRAGYQGIFPEKFTNGKHAKRHGAGQIYDPDAAAKDPDHGKL